ncbi:enoyl-CoA hydratase/isomerase family protein [Rhodococcus spongiicola]|uniref:Enoyl-CoA hydratase/isomerase family protein n=1 Tax=Rhodococcus spongiicola TaxID=2487352 RepID=A0A438AX31_9NOCA|nr:enoyl-CoA hydratase/isomerase family protein [Rhodococcus spongiicola]RVW03247.1 enoyl-CoA hydratase/isomerase family protein [Rhodococcus spongiicola]
MTATLDYRDDIAVLNLGDSENRFSPEWLDTVNAHLGEIETTARGLVTVGAGKFYSNGLDLEWLMANGSRAEWYVGQVQELFNRILTYPLPTIAAVNGHAFGAGAMLAIAHDYRVMREDRGYYCFPEVDINIPFTVGMAALIQAKLTPQTAITAMSTGHRYGGAEAMAAGLVDDTAAESELVTTAISRLAPIAGKDRGTLGAIKATMFSSVTDALRQSRSQ